jgi:hypothetical protein
VRIKKKILPFVSWKLRQLDLYVTARLSPSDRVPRAQLDSLRDGAPLSLRANPADSRVPSSTPCVMVRLSPFKQVPRAQLDSLRDVATLPPSESCVPSLTSYVTARISPSESRVSNSTPYRMVRFSRFERVQHAQLDS